MRLIAIAERLRLDPFTVGIAVATLTATLMPAGAAAEEMLNVVIKALIALMFYLYGAKLSPDVVIEGLAHWRLHGLVLACTYGMFPLFGLLFSVLTPWVLTPAFYSGTLFLCLLPSTVQSSIAFTSIARGNVAAAICSASASNLIGVFATPLLVGLLMKASGGISFQAIEAIILQILVPFMAGQISRPWVFRWAERNQTLSSFSDRGAIILVIYAAFSESVRGGLWRDAPLSSLAWMIGANAVLLALVVITTSALAAALGFNREDRIAIVFCGSKKSMATGIPMANVLFPAASVGALVLPLMVFHQMQLILCAFLARRYARAATEP